MKVTSVIRVNDCSDQVLSQMESHTDHIYNCSKVQKASGSLFVPFCFVVIWFFGSLAQTEMVRSVLISTARWSRREKLNSWCMEQLDWWIVTIKFGVHIHDLRSINCNNFPDFKKMNTLPSA